MTKHLRVLHPAEGILAFYDGRVDGYRFAAGPNWVDDGTLSLGIASYAVVDDDEALVYDTHVSVDHARLVRATLEALGVSKFTVVLSHWHLDHVAGTAAFADCEIVANRRTATHLAARKVAIEAGTLEGPPAIDPLILPTTLFDDRLSLKIGNRIVELIELNIHSDDATVLWLPEQRLLLAGDTLEDTVTYVGEPENFDRHLEDLQKLAALDPASILPNHGDPDIIAGGGYAKALIAATEDYVRALQHAVDDPTMRELTLKEFVAPQLESGSIQYFGPYEEVHRNNIRAVLSSAKNGRR
ncbi:MBL fold metallo-hydrolase [Mesorhizobium sp. LHD-90]|uniref:MBL fold metallo-hydrolase n=1 Tax=Mesorhizobium sp. LHD-90 TaxID=3071414 RepID=UPI0027E07876|nr:MBL fold metallo-hydrolase [Mesorhizobium sp. LHD-90]MDQ6436732.1 MBL fold metallo-hydrolase [Mesorhizobium sp. LHD-90]